MPKMYPFEVQVKLPIINSYNLPQDALSNVIFKLWCHILFMREQTSTSYAELDNPLPSSKHETKWRASMLKTKCSLMEALKSSRDIITAYITIGLTTSCPKELYSIHFKPDFYSTNDLVRGNTILYALILILAWIISTISSSIIVLQFVSL